jgi:hypothetical protein
VKWVILRSGWCTTTVRAALAAVPSLNREVESIYEFIPTASILDEMWSQR